MMRVRASLVTLLRTTTAPVLEIVHSPFLPRASGAAVASWYAQTRALEMLLLTYFLYLLPVVQVKLWTQMAPRRADF